MIWECGTVASRRVDSWSSTPSVTTAERRCAARTNTCCLTARSVVLSPAVVLSIASRAETNTTRGRSGSADPGTDDSDVAPKGDLIRTSLRPATVRVGERVKAVLRIHNVGDRRCTNLVFEFELPQALALDYGRR